MMLTNTMTLFLRTLCRMVRATAVSTILLFMVALMYSSVIFAQGQNGRVIIHTRTLPAVDNTMAIFRTRVVDTSAFGSLVFDNGSQDRFRSGAMSPGYYELVQDALPAGWQNLSTRCTHSGGSSENGFVVEPGETTSCTILNARMGRVVLRHNAQQALDAGEAGFELVGPGGSRKQADHSQDGVLVWRVAAGRHRLLTKPREGYVQSVECSGGQHHSTLRISWGSATACRVSAVRVKQNNASLTVAVTPRSQMTRIGGRATFSITVKNSGNADLFDVATTSATVPGCGRNIGDLPAGSPAVVYGCALNNVRSSVSNLVTARSRSGVTGRDTGTVNVVNSPVASLEVHIAPASRQVRPGGSAQFRITVINTGTRLLEDIRSVDTANSDCSRNLPDLPVGNRTVYDCTVDHIQNSLVNRITIRTAGGAEAAGVMRIDVSNKAVDDGADDGDGGKPDGEADHSAAKNQGIL